MTKKKEITIIAIVSLLVLTITLAISYAFWKVTKTQESTNVIATGCLEVSIISEEDAINLQNAIPISDEEGSSLTPFKMTIKNTCSDEAVEYDANLKILNGTTLDSQYLAVKVDEEKQAILNTLDEVTIDDAKEGRKLKSGILAPNEQETISLRLWMHKDVTYSDATKNKRFEAKVVIDGKPYNKKVILIGTLKDTDDNVLPNEPVTIKSNGETTETITDEDGKIKAPVSPGQYEITANGETITGNTSQNSAEGQNIKISTTINFYTCKKVLKYTCTNTSEQLSDKIVYLRGDCPGDGNYGPRDEWQVLDAGHQTCTGATYYYKNTGNETGITSDGLIALNEMVEMNHPATTQLRATKDWHYIGPTPNNYIKFNNEMWRIIGVFNVDDGTGTLEKRIKIIKNESIGKIRWDTNFVNNWTTSTLKTYLNGDYYNSLTTEAKSQIKDAKWYLGGWNTASIKANDYYNYERGDTVYPGRPTNWTGIIGLMYPSDYSYAVGGENRTTCLNANMDSWNSSTPYCQENDWIREQGINKWTIFPNSNYTNRVFYHEHVGIIGGRDVYSTTVDVYPSLYLRPDIILSGHGTQLDPYIIH